MGPSDCWQEFADRQSAAHHVIILMMKFLTPRGCRRGVHEYSIEVARLPDILSGRHGVSLIGLRRCCWCNEYKRRANVLKGERRWAEHQRCRIFIFSPLLIVKFSACGVRYELFFQISGDISNRRGFKWHWVLPAPGSENGDGLSVIIG